MFYNINRINWTGCLTFPIDFINCIDINDVEEVIDSIAQNVLENIEPGSIIVFHDSAKAFPRMRFALPEVLKFCQERNWQLKCLPQ